MRFIQQPVPRCSAETWPASYTVIRGRTRNARPKVRRRAEHPVDRDQKLPVGFEEVRRETQKVLTRLRAPSSFFTTASNQTSDAARCKVKQQPHQIPFGGTHASGARPETTASSGDWIVESIGFVLSARLFEQPAYSCRILITIFSDAIPGFLLARSGRSLSRMSLTFITNLPCPMNTLPVSTEK